MGGPVHIAITRRARKERVGEFEAALTEFARRSLHEPGTRGVFLLHPTDSTSTEYGIFRSFASAADREAFYKSDLYADWEKRVAPLVEGQPVCRELTGLEAWFRNPGETMPPRWKMAVLTWIAVWPVSMVVPAIVLPLLSPKFNSILAAGLIAAGIVTILTWIAMPLLTKLAHPWLHPTAPKLENT